jgi:hypothetical protein
MGRPVLENREERGVRQLEIHHNERRLGITPPRYFFILFFTIAPQFPTRHLPSRPPARAHHPSSKRWLFGSQEAAPSPPSPWFHATFDPARRHEGRLYAEASIWREGKKQLHGKDEACTMFDFAAADRSCSVLTEYRPDILEDRIIGY